MPAWDEAAVLAQASRLRLLTGQRGAPRAVGGRLGRAAGASLELHDTRAYLPGDDLRRIDWGVYARTDQLVLRRRQALVSPRLVVVLDLSLSMAASPAKLALATGIAALLVQLGRKEEARVDLWLAHAAMQHAPPGPAAWLAALRDCAPHGRAGLLADPAPALPAFSERLVVTDGLYPEGAAALTRRLGREAGSLGVIEVLARVEREPRPLGPVRLEDVEGGARDLVLDERACAAYRHRYERHQAGLREALLGRGPGLVAVTVEEGLEGAARALVAAGVVAGGPA
ncbi:MAG: DUF58 domain-containing protein [Deltaproteobacteria bacterium]|nr:DUF58 domain-containing protein [Deltaproteobacteria bacterium]